MPALTLVCSCAYTVPAATVPSNTAPIPPLIAPCLITCFLSLDLTNFFIPSLTPWLAAKAPAFADPKEKALR